MTIKWLIAHIYDNFGNLASRKDVWHDMEETFTYDDMDRLTGVCLGTTPTGAKPHANTLFVTKSMK